MFSLLSTHYVLNYKAIAEVIAKSVLAGYYCRPDSSSSWPYGEQQVYTEVQFSHCIKTWKDNMSYYFFLSCMRKKVTIIVQVLLAYFFALAYCSKDIREMGSMSHDIKCQACCGGIGCIICFLLAPIRMHGEEPCCYLFSQENCRSVTVWAERCSPDFNLTKTLSKK